MQTMNAFDHRGFFQRFAHHYRQANGITIHYVSGGMGQEVVLLLHGWPQTWYQWRKVMPLLAPHFTVIAPDLRGWGDSQKADDGYDILTLAEDLHQLVEQLQLRSIHLVGHDWGAPVGYAFAAQHPDKVKTLTLMEASMPGIGGEELLNFSQQWSPLWFFPFLATPELAQQLIKGREKKFYGWILSHMAAHPERAFTTADLEYYVQVNTHPGVAKATYQYYSQVYQTAGEIKQLAKNQLPVPVMVIGADRSLGQWMIEAVKKSFAVHARGVVVADCGHVVAEEKPAELTKLLRDFFNSSIHETAT